MTKKTRSKSKKKRSEQKNSSSLKAKNQLLWLAGTVLLCLIIYSPILDADFLNYDDDLYITKNPLLLNLNWTNIVTLFSDFFGNQYAPVAMTIMAVEIALFGTDPVILKLISILLHGGNVIALYFFLNKLTSKPELSIIIAILFGVHTLQVESVAWLAASMKIGTYSLFTLISMNLYLEYVATRTFKSYTLSFVFFLLACLSKEQAVVLPLLLIAIDYLKQRDLSSRNIWIEKVPFFILSMVIGFVTMSVADDMRGSDVALPYSVGERLVFATYAITSYFLKMVTPLELSTFYVYPLVSKTPFYYYMTLLVPGILLAGTYWAWKTNRRMIVFGSIFFFANIALTLLSQILSVRDVIMADRYVYLSVGGFYLVILSVLLGRRSFQNFKKTSIFWGVAGYILLLSALTYQRTKVWKGDSSFMANAIEMAERWNKANSPAMAVAHTNMGVALKNEGNMEASMRSYKEAIKCNPNYALAYTNLGNALMLTGKLSEAESNYNKALSINPENEKALSGRGAVYAQTRRYDLALRDLDKAIELDPDHKDAYSNRFLTYYQMQRYQDALADVKKLIEFDPSDASAYHDMGVTLSILGRKQDALVAYTEALQLAPQNAGYLYSRANLNRDLGNRRQAYEDAIKAQQLGYQVDPAFLQSVK